MTEADRTSDSLTAAYATPEEAWSALRNLAQDSKVLASELMHSLDALVKTSPGCSSATRHDALAQVRDSAANLRDFLSWAAEDPMTLTVELRAIAAMELRLEEREGYGEESDRIISWLHANWEATGAVDLEGQAPASPLKRLAKKILRTLLSPMGRVLLGKQNQVNARLVQLLSGSIPTLRDGLGDVETRGDQRFSALEKEVRRLAGEVERLEKKLDGGTDREREGQ